MSKVTVGWLVGSLVSLFSFYVRLLGHARGIRIVRRAPTLRSQNRSVVRGAAFAAFVLSCVLAASRRHSFRINVHW
jgi:hypothetical protein